MRLKKIAAKIINPSSANGTQKLEIAIAISFLIELF